MNKVEWAYKNLKNIKVVDNLSDNDLCYIYFSSNALYTDPDSFVDKVINNDRYEWEHIRPIIIPRREIFVRDVFRSWYVKGINEAIGNYDSLCSYLDKITKGYHVRCIGASSGGYIATLVSSKLNFECISFAGQFSLLSHFDHYKNNAFLRQYILEHGDDSLELQKHYLKNKNIKIFYIMPLFSEQDIIQYDAVKDNSNIHTIFVKTKKHGVALYPYALPNFLAMSTFQIDSLCSGKKYNKLLLSSKLGGYKEGLAFFCRKLHDKYFMRV